MVLLYDYLELSSKLGGKMTALPSTFTIFENSYFSVLLFSSFLEFVVILTVFITFLGNERDFDAVLGCEMTARTHRCRLIQK